MLINFSPNIFRQIQGIVWFNKLAIFLFILLAVGATVGEEVYKLDVLCLPVLPVTLLGGGLAIFLGFRNNAAYDRWWEGRKVWGGIVNDSRSWGIEVMTLLSPYHSKHEVSESKIEEFKKRVMYRHVAWINALRLHLRKRDQWDQIRHLLSDEDWERLQAAKNKPSQILLWQSEDLKRLHELKIIEDFRHIEMIQQLKSFYNHQGKCERIKNTIFPFYYTYFTGVFLWLFLLMLPFALVEQLGWYNIPISIAISFVFYILDKSGRITEDPFEDRAADVPMTSMCRSIEIDLRQYLGETDLPQAPAPERTAFGGLFLR